MTWTTPRTWVAGETVTAAMMNSQIRDNLNVISPLGDITAMTNFTPAFTSTGTAPNLGSTGSASGTWMKVGGFTVAQFLVNFAGTGVSAGTGTYLLGLPTAASAAQPLGQIGSGTFFDTSLTQYTAHAAMLLNTTQLVFRKGDSSGTGWAATAPAAPAAGDQFTGFVVYGS